MRRDVNALALAEQRRMKAAAREDFEARVVTFAAKNPDLSLTDIGRAFGTTLTRITRILTQARRTT